MKWKITGQFLLMIIIIFITIVIINYGSAIFYFFYSNKGETNYYRLGNPENFTLNFSENLMIENNIPAVSESGIKQLMERKAWIQVLDEDGTEVYNLDKPSDAPGHYIPGELIFAHKFSNVIKGYTIFAGLYEKNNRKFTYIIGFPESYVSKYTMIYRPENLLGIMPGYFLMAFILSVILVAVMGYLFSSRLAKPLAGIIDGIKGLSRGDFLKSYPEKGLYKDVYKSLNILSSTLKSNEIERKNTERIREEWIANISHDMKTPLASIKGYAELMNEPEYVLSDKEKKKYTSTILEKSKYMEELVEDLKLTYQLKNSLKPLSRKDENIVDTLRDAVIGILNHPKYETRQIDFNADDENIVWSFDSSLMKRAFTNVIFNAVSHNSTDTEISVSINKENGINICIEDNGKGMSRQDLERLFERYYRGTNTGEAHKGSGLGMAIAKQIIEAHGGTIDVQSELGKGTKVNIHF